MSHSDDSQTMTAPTTNTSPSPSIPAQTRIGHVHLKVADLDRAVRFYHEVMGFDLLFNAGTAAFLSAGGYHHHIGLNTWECKDGAPPAPGTTGLYHFAINYPTRRDLAAALKRLLDHGWEIDGASDHTTHEAIYLHDPDHNGIELAWDRDPSYWGLMRGATLETLRSTRKPLDFDSLLAELDDPQAERYLPDLRRYH
jgi:catechol 2,3-dioxygenase